MPPPRCGHSRLSSLLERRLCPRGTPVPAYGLTLPAPVKMAGEEDCTFLTHTSAGLGAGDTRQAALGSRPERPTRWRGASGAEAPPSATLGGWDCQICTQWGGWVRVGVWSHTRDAASRRCDCQAP